MSIETLNLIGRRYAKPFNASSKAHVLKPGEEVSMCGATNLGKTTRKRPEQWHVCIRCAKSAKLEWENSGDLDYKEALMDFTVPMWEIVLPDGFIATRSTSEQFVKERIAKVRAKHGEMSEIREGRCVVTGEGTIVPV